MMSKFTWSFADIAAFMAFFLLTTLASILADKYLGPAENLSQALQKALVTTAPLFIYTLLSWLWRVMRQ